LVGKLLFTRRQQTSKQARAKRQKVEQVHIEDTDNFLNKNPNEEAMTTTISKAPM
jgi:hypothetical protein